MLYVSPAYERIWGRSCAELYASPRRWLDAIHPEDRKRVIAGLAGQGDGAYDIEYRILDAAGRVRWIRDRAFPVLDAAGQVYRIAGVADDMHARARGPGGRARGGGAPPAPARGDGGRMSRSAPRSCARPTTRCGWPSAGCAR